jgi:hypothetical protein
MVLNMRAKLFLRILKNGWKIKEQEMALQNVSLCDAFSVSLGSDGKRYEQVREFFMKRAFPDLYKRKGMPLESPETVRIVQAALGAVPTNLVKGVH